MNQPLQHVAGNVYAAPGDMERVAPWVGVVVTPEGTVLVDGGNGPRQAALIQQGLDRLDAPPVTHILLTHHHWDHIFGCGSFPGARVIAHEQTQHHLQVMAGEPWSAAYLERKWADDPRGRIIGEYMTRAVPDWSDFQVVPAHETFQSRFSLTVGGTQFRVEHVGGQHEPDQAIVHVLPADVLFLGDAAYGRAGSREWDRGALAGTLEGFLARGAAFYVEGHRPPATPERFRARIERLRRPPGPRR